MLTAGVIAPHAEATVLALMRATAALFRTRLLAHPGIIALPPPQLPSHGPELRWHNALFAAAEFRRAHVELLEIDNHFAVVHVVVLPRLSNPQPIFGFDMIAGRLQATGVFLDFSAVVAQPRAPFLGDIITPAARGEFTQTRIRPEWGSIFSPDFFAVRPAGEPQIRAALALAVRAFDHYMHYLTPHGDAMATDPAVINGQSTYARAQRRNPHTEKMLARFVGAPAARAFIDDILFPLPA